MTLIETIIKTLEKEYDDIIWDFGVDDPRHHLGLRRR
jgi:hypothetical protein